MSQTGAWRIPAQYRYALNLDDAGFAWEFLRRNEDFAAEARQTNNTDADLIRPASVPRPDEPAAAPERQPRLTRRSDPLAHWGLHFRAGPTPQRV